MHPAKPGGMLAAKDGVVALAMILVTPGTVPKLLVVCSHHAAFTTGRQNLVLTERECRYVPERADGFSFVRRAMSLSTILDNLQAMLLGQFKNWVHVTGPSGEMNRDNGFGFRRDRRPNGFRRDVLAIAVYIHAKRTRAAHDSTTGGRDERPGSGYDFVSRSNPQRVERQFQRQRPIGYTDPVLRPNMTGKLRLELASFLSRPIIHLARTKYRGHRLDFITREARPR